MKIAYFRILFIVGLLVSCSNETTENNDSITVSFSTDSFSASEDAIDSEVSISLDVIGGVTTEDVLIQLTYTDGSANANDVVDDLPVLITIPAGDYTTISTFDISLSIFDDDIDEATEDLILSLSSESENVIIEVPNQFNIAIADNDVTFDLRGLEFALINYIVEEPMDLNNDGVFSTDLLEEGIVCVMETIEFREDNTIYDPTLSSTGLEVNGGIQEQICVSPDGGPLDYVLEEGIINLSFLEQYYYSGVLSDDNSLIEFDIPFERVVGFQSFFGGNEYISENNGVQLYTGGVIAIYELIE